MIKCFFVVLSVIILFSGCAGMDPRYQDDVTRNTVGGGVVGAIVGAGISAATGGNAGAGILWGGLAGSVLGFVNTPPPGANYYPYYHYRSYPYGYPSGPMCYERYRNCDIYSRCWFEFRPTSCW